MNRIGLKIACLVASVIIWVQVASHSTVEQNANLPLVVTGLGDNLTFEGSQLPREVTVRLQGSKLRLLMHNYFNQKVGEVRVNLWDQQPGPEFSYEVVSSDIYSDLKVLGIHPPVRLRIHIDTQEFKLLPVVQDNTSELRAGLAFLEPPKLLPDSVLVSGPSRFFLEHTVVQAQPVDFSKLKQSERLSVRLIQPGQFLHLATSQVSLDCLVAEIEDRTLANIPVVPLVDAGRPPVGVSPPVVDVMVRGVADSVLALTTNRFLVTVSVGNLDEGIYQLTGQVDKPDWLEVIGLDPPEFQVIVGSPTVSLDSLFQALDSQMSHEDGLDE